MTVMSSVQAFPRVVVERSIQAVRLPLTAAARAARQQDNHQWPPTVVFERFHADVETVIGSLIRDSILVEAGRARLAKAAQLRKAAELHAVAEQERLAADERAEERRDQIAAQRKKTARKAKQSKNDIAAQAERDEQKVRGKAAKKTAAGRQVKKSQDEAIARRERVAKASSLETESQALDVTKEALQAAEKRELIDETLDAAKAARTNS